MNELIKHLKLGAISYLFLLLLFTATSAQKTQTMVGDMWKGSVVAVDSQTREITISYPNKSKTETFKAILPQGYQMTMSDGTQHEVQMSEVVIGSNVRIFAKAKDENVNGVKTKGNKDCSERVRWNCHRGE
ncbi:MAG TPA: hypothetical protein VI306_18870 [Pyrinomonadaceae bacterium]